VQGAADSRIGVIESAAASASASVPFTNINFPLSMNNALRRENLLEFIACRQGMRIFSQKKPGHL
jgi:hypothetical protein